MAEKILEVKNLVTQFTRDKHMVTVVDDLSFDLFRGSALAIVGESGSGKSAMALSLMRLIVPPLGRVTGMGIFLEGKDILQLSSKEMEAIRGNRISMVFQEPMTALNPVYTIGQQIMETIQLHQKVSPKEAKTSCIALLTLVGIPAPQQRMLEYPHQMSGGMRQRVMIAIALACDPSVLIADEPTTALDVTTQAQAHYGPYSKVARGNQYGDYTDYT
jgi:ABC-type dipeptide/oligopeptide/nickel transport system ATPase component